MYPDPLSYLYAPLFDLKLILVTSLNKYGHIAIIFKNNSYKREMKKIKLFTNLLKIFLKASQHKVVSVCILIIFYMEVDLLVRTSRWE